MKMHIILHAAFESPGVIHEWALDNGYEVTLVHPYRGDPLPIPGQIDFLVSMGGPQSALEIENYPYLQTEVVLLRDVLAQRKRVLGVCLGAQLMGVALGAPAARSPAKEVGMFPIELTKAGRNDPTLAGLPAAFKVMHWHNDMAGLPEGSEVLAASAGCPRQIIRFRDNAYGFQCHLEMTPVMVQGMLAHCTDDLRPGTYIQTADTMLAEEYMQMNQYLRQVLAQWQ
jgi:GMP synthase (glutamine-hydrolysing)